jgi:hypothetical protein
LTGRESLSTSRGLNRFTGQKNGPSCDTCYLAYFGLVSLVTATTADEEGDATAAAFHLGDAA